MLINFFFFFTTKLELMYRFTSQNINNIDRGHREIEGERASSEEKCQEIILLDVFVLGCRTHSNNK